MHHRINGKIIVPFIIFFGAACRQTLKGKIIDGFNQYCFNDTGNCQLCLNALVSFEWDKMYVFGSNADAGFISRTVGFDYYGRMIPESFRRIMFTWGRHEVYEEDFNPFSYTTSVVDFKSISDSILKIRSYSFTPEEAVFVVKKEKISGSCKSCFLYELTNAGKPAQLVIEYFLNEPDNK
jgi:hypothetical protein